jgi:hypothetical protein
LAELATIPTVVGIKFMTYVDSDHPETYSTIVEEVRLQADAAHAVGLLFFPEDLPAKSVAGRPFDEVGQVERSRWEARNPILFAKALREGGVDYDAYKFAFPGNLDMPEAVLSDHLKEMAGYTQGRLLMMLSGGAKDTAERARVAAQHGLSIVGFFPGRGVWGEAFWNVPPAPQGDIPGKAQVLEAIKADLRGEKPSKVGEKTTKDRYMELADVRDNRMQPYWVHLSLTEGEITAGLEEAPRALEEVDWSHVVAVSFDPAGGRALQRVGIGKILVVVPTPTDYRHQVDLGMEPDASLGIIGWGGLEAADYLQVDPRIGGFVKADLMTSGWQGEVIRFVSGRFPDRRVMVVYDRDSLTSGLEELGVDGATVAQVLEARQQAAWDLEQMK